jgi:hypothetical protein
MLLPKLSLKSTGLALAILFAGTSYAAAAGVEVIVPAPFYPRAEFNYEGGYYRTGDGHYYHYDRDREGWHHGRNHREGLRFDHRGHK